MKRNRLLASSVLGKVSHPCDKPRTQEQAVDSSEERSAICLIVSGVSIIFMLFQAVIAQIRFLLKTSLFK